MKRKARKRSDLKKRISQTQKIKTTFENFKKVIELRLGKINWQKVGTYSLALLFLVALSGLLGPKARLLSLAIVKYAAMA